MRIRYVNKLLMDTVRSHRLHVGHTTCRVDWKPHDWITIVMGKKEGFLLSFMLMDHTAWFLKRSHLDSFRIYLRLHRLSISLYIKK